MSMLVICEKPSVAADVARALQAGRSFEKQPWGYESADLLVAAAAGHLVAELPPEKYDPKYKTWVYEDLPVIPERFLYEPRDDRAATRLRQLSELMRRADVTEIVNACDAGREGEHIFKLIIQFARLGSSKTIKRAWFSSMTNQAIQEAFANLRDDREMLPLENAARCRAEADWLVGMNATRAASCTLGGNRQLLSVGRVQTPTLALVVRRDLEIENFVPEDYFQVRTDFLASGRNAAGWWRSSRDKDGTDRFAERLRAEALADATRATGQGHVADIEVKDETVGAPRLFDLTDLQREANKRFGITAAKTLEAAQALYETHKFLSYPRTDSRYITSDMASAIPALIRRVKAAAPEYAVAADAVLAACDPTVLVNDAKVNDHHAILPTDAVHDLTKLSTDERRIYDLVARRALAALLPPQKLQRTIVWVRVDAAFEEEESVWFRIAGKVELEPGWRIAMPTEAEKSSKKGAAAKEADDEEDATDDDGELPAMTVGEALPIKGVEVVDRQTKAPPRYNEASLLGIMATAGRLVSDEEAADAMKESGLGTPATRASILERLMKVEYLERQGRQLRATAKGRGLIIALGEHPLTAPDLTGEWERRLRHLERAKPEDADTLRDEFSVASRKFAAEITAGFAAMTPELLKAGRRIIAPCPVPTCTGSISETRSGWGCDSWKSREEPGCGFAVWKDRGGKKTTEKDVHKYITDVLEGRVTVRPAGPRTVIGACPKCSMDVVERPASWGCSSWKSPKDTGCGYVIWRKDPDGSEVDEARAKDMLALGKSNAREKPPAFAPCPRCSGNIVERAKSYSCDSWSPSKKGCGTTVWKVQASQEVTPEEVLAQLEAMKGTKAEKPKKRTAKK
jgi:DNA topoisomerase-3